MEDQAQGRSPSISRALPGCLQGGAVIFSEATGRVPGLNGRLNPDSRHPRADRSLRRQTAHRRARWSRSAAGSWRFNISGPRTWRAGWPSRIPRISRRRPRTEDLPPSPAPLLEPTRRRCPAAHRKHAAGARPGVPQASPSYRPTLSNCTLRRSWARSKATRPAVSVSAMAKVWENVCHPRREIRAVLAAADVLIPGRPLVQVGGDEARAANGAGVVAQRVALPAHQPDAVA